MSERTVRVLGQLLTETKPWSDVFCSAPSAIDPFICLSRGCPGDPLRWRVLCSLIGATIEAYGDTRESAIAEIERIAREVRDYFARSLPR